MRGRGESRSRGLSSPMQLMGQVGLGLGLGWSPSKLRLRLGLSGFEPGLVGLDGLGLVGLRLGWAWWVWIRVVFGSGLKRN